MVEFPPLPYPSDALEPHVSERALKIHHEQNVRGYVDTCNEILAELGMPEADATDAIRIAYQTNNQRLLDAARQVINHMFFFESMRPDGGGPPEHDDNLMSAIERQYGGWEGFRTAWLAASKSVFGSGYVWAVWSDNAGLIIVPLPNADMPSDYGAPVVSMDVWEHAYVYDYESRRKAWAEAYLDHLVSWPS